MGQMPYLRRPHGLSRPDLVSDDQLVKRVRYARAGIEYYWIVRMAQNHRPAMAIERLKLTSDGTYATVKTSQGQLR
jgi:hypothetical protein